MNVDLLKNTRVLVTGGAGFIGSHLVDELLTRGASVCVLDDLSTGYEKNLEHCLSKINFIKADIQNFKACEQACYGIDYVLHQAALGSVPRSIKNPLQTLSVNYQGTANIFEAAKKSGVKRVVYASSSSVYGDNLDNAKVEGKEGNLLSPYALSKKNNEDLAKIYYRCFNLEVIGLRYFNVFGARQYPNGPYAAVCPAFFNAAINGKKLKIFGNGEQSRDFTFIKNVVQANMLALFSPKESCSIAYNVGAGKKTSINQL
ncbi:SDR family NAD(P)-dependent oxidoreductase, partial [Sulfobacillus acidophilus]|nr:SDR family NAD(P)-dependent oxidoreductase [Sulfobacillus acidophilus]